MKKHPAITWLSLLVIALLTAMFPLSTAQANTRLQFPQGIISVGEKGGDFVWAKQFTGDANNQGSGRKVFTDSSGNIYISGLFSYSADFDPGSGVFNMTSAGEYDCFISKLDPNGNFIWAKQIGGTDYEFCASTIDPAGNVYLTGYFYYSADFDPGSGTFTLTAPISAIFVSKLDQNGNFVWAKKLGGSESDSGGIGRGIAVDASGNVYINGNFEGIVDFNPGAGTYNMDADGIDDIFVCKLDSSGNFVWAKQMGSSASDYGYALAIDSAANVYTTGSFSGTADFDPGSGVYYLTSSGGWDIFVSKLDTNGNFVWAGRMGGPSTSNDDIGKAIAVDATGAVYTTGIFYETADFDPGSGTYNLTSALLSDIFISKLDSNGNFVWAKRMGNNGADRGNAIALDSSGNVYTSGAFYGSVDFNPGAGAYTLTSAGGADIFISQLDSSGNFLSARHMGGSSTDESYGLFVDSSLNIFTTGDFYTTADFDPGPSVFNLTSSGSSDVFISKLGDNTPPAVSGITLADPNPTSAATVNFTIAFSEPVIGVDSGAPFNDFSLATTGDITGAEIHAISGSGATRTVTVNTGSGVGTIRLDIPGTASITDLAGNPLGGLPYQSGQAYTIHLSFFLPLITR